MSLPIKEDCLTTQPPEILLRIIANLPHTEKNHFSKDFLSLTKVNQSMKGVFRAHAYHICNDAIQNQFGTSAAILMAKKINNWLVPTEKNFNNIQALQTWHELGFHPMIREQEDILLAKKLGSCDHCSAQLSYTEKYGFDYITSDTWFVPTTCPIPHEKKLRILLSEPGPQFLSFIEKHDVHIKKCWDAIMGDREMVAKYGTEAARAEFEDRVGVNHVRIFLAWLDGDSDEHAGKWWKQHAAETRRDLDWYYGDDGVGK